MSNIEDIRKEISLGIKKAQLEISVFIDEALRAKKSSSNFMADDDFHAYSLTNQESAGAD